MDTQCDNIELPTPAVFCDESQRAPQAPSGMRLGHGAALVSTGEHPNRILVSRARKVIPRAPKSPRPAPSRAPKKPYRPKLVEHCGEARTTDVYFLRPSRDAWDFDVFYVAYCPVCKKPVIEFGGYTLERGKHSRCLVPTREHHKVFDRLATPGEVIHRTDPSRLPKDTRAKIHVGQHTLDMSKDPADAPPGYFAKKVLEAMGRD